MTVAGGSDGLDGRPAQTQAATYRVLQFRADLVKAAREKSDSDSSDRPAAATARERARLDATHRPLVDGARDALLRYCNWLARQSALRGYAEAEDLAQDAWNKMMVYLAGPNGERVRDDAHFARLLNRAAFSRFLDLLPRANRETAASEADALEGRTSAWGATGARTPESEVITLSDEGLCDLIALLFADEEAFQRINRRRKNARHPRQYQAFVLYGLGERYRSETGAENEATEEGSQLAAWLLDKFADGLGVPLALWEAVRTAAALPPHTGPSGDNGGNDALEAGLAGTVNGLCGTNVRDRKTLAVYRYELNQLVEVARTER